MIAYPAPLSQVQFTLSSLASERLTSRAFPSTVYSTQPNSMERSAACPEVGYFRAFDLRLLGSGHIQKVGYRSDRFCPYKNSIIGRKG